MVFLVIYHRFIPSIVAPSWLQPVILWNIATNMWRVHDHAK